MYFTVDDKDGAHVGTIRAYFTEDFLERLQDALDDHFDFEVEIKEKDLTHILRGRRGDVFEIHVRLEDHWDTVIIVRHTWVY
jgi:hypothetical protein